MSQPLAGKTAIVSGGGTGIGRGICLALASDGANIVIAGRRVDAAAAVIEEIEARGANAIAVMCDVTRRSDVDEAVAASVERFGGIDILVNNAQARRHGYLLDIGEEEWELALQSGLMGSFRFMVAAHPFLKERQGVIVNTISGTGLVVIPKRAPYTATKEAIRVLTRTAAIEWAPDIRVVAVSPMAWTEGMAATNEQEDPDLVDQIVKNMPLARMGDPEADIGRAVAFLVGPDASYITGTSLQVDGGFHYHH